MLYQIKIQGKLDMSWSDWLSRARMTSELDETGLMITTITVELADQPALFGILDRIRDMNLLPVAVERMDREK
jgi:hypothetical protein